MGRTTTDRGATNTLEFHVLNENLDKLSNFYIQGAYDSKSKMFELYPSVYFIRVNAGLPTGFGEYELSLKYE
jgi:hypothetical protein